jgi:hypothetical protein
LGTGRRSMRDELPNFELEIENNLKRPQKAVLGGCNLHLI